MSADVVVGEQPAMPHRALARPSSSPTSTESANARSASWAADGSQVRSAQHAVDGRLALAGEVLGLDALARA